VSEYGGGYLDMDWGSRVSFSYEPLNKSSQLGPETPEERKERNDKDLKWKNDRLKLDEEKTQYSKEGLQLSQQGLDLDRQNLALSQEALKLDQEKLRLEKWHLLMVILGGAAAIYTYSSEQYRRQLDELNQDTKSFVATCRGLRTEVEFIESRPRGWLLNVKREDCHTLGTKLKNALSESENLQRKIRYLKTTWFYSLNGFELDKLERRLYRHHYDLFIKVGLAMNDAILYHMDKNYEKGIQEIADAKKVVSTYLDEVLKLSSKGRQSTSPQHRRQHAAGSTSQEHRHHLRLIGLIASLHNLEGMIQRKAQHPKEAEYQYLRALSIEQFATQLKESDLWEKVLNLLEGETNTITIDSSDGPLMVDRSHLKVTCDNVPTCSVGINKFLELQDLRSLDFFAG